MEAKKEISTSVKANFDSISQALKNGDINQIKNWLKEYNV